MPNDCEFFAALEPAEVGRRVIRDIRPDLGGAVVKYLFRSEPEKIKGRKALATAQVVRGLKAALTKLENFELGEKSQGEPFFLISVWWLGWRNLSDSQRFALMDHELAHCCYEVDEDEEEKYSTVGHDIEEFHAIAKRHGAWMPSYRDFVKAIDDYEAGQPRLLMVAGE